jgi:xanthine dehydrogenase accessory factor
MARGNLGIWKPGKTPKHGFVMREILRELTEALNCERPCVYCSVIETRGSTPQKAGAAMLVFPDGSQRGTLGGGCVEAEVRQKALKVLSEDGGRPDVLTFCLDDNYGWDDGLICGGRMSILAAPLQSSDRAGRAEQNRSYYRRYLDLVENGKGCTEAIVFQSPDGLGIGNRFLFDAENQFIAQHGDGPIPTLVEANLTPLSKRPGPKAQQGIAYLPILPRITLLIVGAGHVGQAVAQLATQVDFDVWVLDDREAFVSPQRFPTAQRRLVGAIDTHLKDLAGRDINPSFYCLVVTRGHNHDEEALYHLATTSAGYVGMIGSKRKIKLIYEDLIAKGVSPEALNRVHAPLGLDIGSQTVPEIAVSIVAELIACRNLGTTAPPSRARVRADTIRQ